jgi:hypothetical protein
MALWTVGLWAPKFGYLDVLGQLGFGLPLSEFFIRSRGFGLPNLGLGLRLIKLLGFFVFLVKNLFHCVFPKITAVSLAFLVIYI